MQGLVEHLFELTSTERKTLTGNISHFSFSVSSLYGSVSVFCWYLVIPGCISSECAHDNDNKVCDLCSCPTQWVFWIRSPTDVLENLFRHGFPAFPLFIKGFSKLLITMKCLRWIPLMIGLRATKIYGFCCTSFIRKTRLVYSVNDPHLGDEVSCIVLVSKQIVLLTTQSYQRVF